MLSPSTPTPLPARAAGLAVEFLFSTAAAFLITLALLPLFDLHPSLFLVLRVTALTTLAVFAALHTLFRSFGHTHPAATEPNDNPEFKLTPRCARDVELPCRLRAFLITFHSFTTLPLSGVIYNLNTFQHHIIIAIGLLRRSDGMRPEDNEEHIGRAALTPNTAKFQ
ncbi:hypothetical protein B0H15DRAFT_801457 [Mycena belliarum]|uniref:Uncharacterized protein n=1 Tax=Mycena belliarum TaxID=1033014 RepID=A0AAD6U1V0_9AGAR|nr:hypothetical protein B0H15DRAFT_801457 [Mycena belliae]